MASAGVSALAIVLIAGIALPAFAQEDARLFERAREQLEAMVRVNPADFKARSLLGRAYALQGHYDKALEQYRQAATLGDQSVHLLVADVLADRGEDAAAREAYETARLHAKRGGDALRAAEADLGLAQLDLLRGDLDKVLAAVERVQGGDKQAASRLRARLLALQSAARAGQVLKEGPVAVWTDGARAREALERALSVDDSDPRVLYALGRFYLEAPPGFGDRDRAELLMARAAKLRRANAVYRAWHIHALAIRGRQTEAQTELEAFEAAFGGSPAARAVADRLRRGEPPF
ncbi:MAG: tetratricopeptide repeat protein [Candidatus Sericytochromatia bacterium]|nr:tetratricopeptide repeat protein [Candidatus Tanganyikabacteria bacterium]